MSMNWTRSETRGGERYVYICTHACLSDPALPRACVSHHRTVHAAGEKPLCSDCDYDDVARVCILGLCRARHRELSDHNERSIRDEGSLGADRRCKADDGRAHRPARGDDARHCDARFPACLYLLRELHGARRGDGAFLRVHFTVLGIHARACRLGQLPPALRVLGGCRPVFLSADRVLLPQGIRSRGGEKSVHHNAHR